MDVAKPNIRSSRVPTDNLFLAVDAAHHVEELLVVDLIKEPDFRLLQILFKRHSVAICHVKDALIAIKSE